MSRLPEGVEGWLSEGQAEVLHDRAAQVRDGGRVVEIGSFRGRSTIVLARAAAPGVEIVAVDPHLGSDRGPQEIAEDRALGDADVETFRANLATAGVAERVRHVRKRSTEALAALDGDVDLLYVDGAHRYRPALADVRDWGARVRPGGRMLVHDAFSSIGVTLALLRALAFSGAWRYAGRERSLAEYVKEPAGSRLANAGRQVAQLPWFARNLAIKVLVLLRLRRGPWPY
jgi:predicted O-methyltransferase YrrM